MRCPFEYDANRRVCLSITAVKTSAQCEEEHFAAGHRDPVGVKTTICIKHIKVVKNVIEKLYRNTGICFFSYASSSTLDPRQWDSRSVSRVLN